ncbi:MAG: hypothetical protein IKV80_03805 [Bacteroidales bacterium]|nr:hypothetical protein [Bacteroidales bacterium]
MTTIQNKWNADAEASMMGFTVHIENEEHLTHLVKYVLNTLKGEYHYDLEEKTKEVVESATRKYNSGKDKSIKWFTTNATQFGTCLTFVRDKGTPTKRNGVLAWVENLDYPDCSELGYVFFENVNGKVRRIA